MKLKIHLRKKQDIERFLLISNLGITTALSSGSISIEDAEQCLYNLRSIRTLHEIGIDKRIIKLIELGCELEDVESLLPDNLHDEINKLKTITIELLNELPKPLNPNQKWIKF